jgi:hypothetical protein
MLIDHEIIADELAAVPSSSYAIFAGFDAPYYDLPHLLLYFFPLFLADVFGKVSHGPHIAGNLTLMEFGVILLYGVIGEMYVPIVDIVEIIVLGTEPHIALVIEPHFGRIKILYEHPLPNIELPAQNHQRILDVFLRHILYVLAKTVVHNVEQVVEAADAAATGHVVGLHDPDVVVPVHLDLGVDGF